MTVAELGRRMTSHEVAEWAAYFRLEAEDAETRRRESELERTARTNARALRQAPPRRRGR